MTTSQDLLCLAEKAVLGPQASANPPVYATAAQNRVYQPGDWPTQSDQYPIIKMRLTTENRTALGHGSIIFTTVATIEIVAEVSAKALPQNAGAKAAELAAWALKRQIETAVVNSYPLTEEIQQFQTINSRVDFDSSGETHIAVLSMNLALEFVESGEDFAPIAAVPLETANVGLVNFAGTGTTITLPQETLPQE